MIVAKVKIYEASAMTVWANPITAGMIGAEVEIEYACPVWAVLTKTVVFSGAVVKDVIANDTVIGIPAECLAVPNAMLKVGVYGISADDTLAIPTLWAPIGRVLRGTDPSGDETTNPTLPVWAEILELAKKAEQIAQDLRQDAEAGRFDGKDGDPGSPGYTPVKGVDYFTPDEVAGIEVGAAAKLEPNISQLKDDLSDNAKSDAETKRRLEALWKLNQGISYDFVVDSEQAYEKVVPSGGKYAAVNMIGGHTEVIDSVLVSAYVETITCYGANVLDLSDFKQNEYLGVKLENTGDGVIRVTGTATTSGQVWIGPQRRLQKKASSYTVKSFSSYKQDWNKKGCVEIYNSDNTLTTDYGAGKQGFLTDDKLIRICVRVISGVTYDDTISVSVCVGDQTISKYTPALEPIQNTIPESVRNLPGYGWSSGEVCNAIERTDTGWQYVQRVGSREYQDGDAVTDGVTTYYALDTPVITDITDLMADFQENFAVEAGGTITFDNAAKLTVPNRVEYVVSLAEVGSV